MKQKEPIKTLKALIKELDKSAISKEHDKAEINWECAECQFRLLKAGLEWWLGVEEWILKQNETKSIKKA